MDILIKKINEITQNYCERKSHIDSCRKEAHRLFSNPEYNKFLSGFDKLSYSILDELDIIHARTGVIMDEISRGIVNREFLSFLEQKNTSFGELRKSLVEHFTCMGLNFREHGISYENIYHSDGLDEIYGVLKNLMSDVGTLLMNIMFLVKNFSYSRTSDIYYLINEPLYRETLSENTHSSLVELHKDLYYNKDISQFLYGENGAMLSIHATQQARFMELLISNSDKYLSYKEIAEALSIKSDAMGRDAIAKVKQIKDDMYRKIRKKFTLENKDFTFINTKNGFKLTPFREE